IEGSGAGGRVSKSDVLNALESGGAGSSAAASSAPRPATPSAPPPASGGSTAHGLLENAVPRDKIYFGNYEAKPMSTMRQPIAEHMVASKHVSPHVYSIDEVDVTGVVKLREKSKGAFESNFGTKLTYTPFFVRACVEALRTFPTVNASADG